MYAYACIYIYMYMCMYICWYASYRDGTYVIECPEQTDYLMLTVHDKVPQSQITVF